MAEDQASGGGEADVVERAVEVDGEGEAESASAELKAARGQARAERKKRQELQARLEKFEEANKAAADEEAARRGLVEKVQAERDQAAESLKIWTEYGASRLEAVAETLPEKMRDVLELIPEGPQRLLAAEKMLAEGQANEAKQKPAIGGTGGPAKADRAGLIPAEITTKFEYNRWLVNPSAEVRRLLGTAEGRAKVFGEAAERGLR